MPTRSVSSGMSTAAVILVVLGSIVMVALGILTGAYLL